MSRMIKLEERKKKRKIVENAARFFGFSSLLKKEDFRLRDKEVFLLSRDLGKVLDKIDGMDEGEIDETETLTKNLVSAGIKVGEAGRRFRFSLEGTFFLARKEKKRVYVDGKAEMLFLYGRDVFSSSVEKVTQDVRENDIVFVCNRYGDIIGIGRARFDAKEISKKGERVAVENLVDRGEYLRKEKLYASF